MTEHHKIRRIRVRDTPKTTAKPPQFIKHHMAKLIWNPNKPIESSWKPLLDHILHFGNKKLS